MTIETLGSERIGNSITGSCDVARNLAAKPALDPGFEPRAPVALNIVCFGIRGASDQLTRDLVLSLHESGLAVPSWTMSGKLSVRCAIVNHRTTKADIDNLLSVLGRYLA
jgi:aromatic-L-amino-acid decarboxylase